MEGLFQLLIILFFIVASIFDAVSRNRKKQEQKERLDREEGAGGALEGGAEGARVERPRPGAPARPRPRPTPVEGRRKAPTGESAPRETADQMIPEDFWAVLTGQAPAQRTPEPSPPEARAPEPAAAAPESARWESGAMAPMGMGGEGDRGAMPEEATGTRRSSRWMEGLESDMEGGPGEEEERRSAMMTPRRPAAIVPGTRTFPQAPPPPPKPASPFARRRIDPMEEPWGDLEDISRGEIGDGRGAVQGAVDLDGGGASRRQGSSTSPFVRLVASGRQQDLQAAIVLREVLGAPVGSRSPSEGPGGWNWEDR